MDTVTTTAQAVANLMVVVAQKLEAQDLTYAAQSYLTAAELVDRMISALPDIVVTDPPIGPCYTPAALAQWKRVSRQAIAKQRSTGKLFAVTINRSVFYPAVQFDNHGRPLTAFRELAQVHCADNPLEFAVWLQAPNADTGTSPAEDLWNAPDTRSDQQRMMDEFEPTIVQPPFGSTQES